MSGRLLCIALLAALSAAAQESPNRVLTLDGHVHYQDFILFADLLDHNGGPAGKVRALLAERFALPTTLRPNFPNPFNASTTLVYALAAAGPVALIVYDIMGQEIRRLADARQAAGVYRFTWDGRDERGTRVSSGHYFAILHTPTARRTQKLLLLK
jgi:hypothetical protein